MENQEEKNLKTRDIYGNGTITKHSRKQPWSPQQLSQNPGLEQALGHRHHHSPLGRWLNQWLLQEPASGIARPASSGFPSYLVLYFNNKKC